jgi:streptogramin lyase
MVLCCTPSVDYAEYAVDTYKEIPALMPKESGMDNPAKRLSRTLVVAIVLGGMILAGGASAAEAVTVKQLPLEFKHPALPIQITAGPDGDVWFTVIGAPDRVDRLTPKGQLTEFPIGFELSPRGITSGPDGNLWFTLAGPDTLGRITPKGLRFLFPSNILMSEPTEITAGAEGNLWFTESGGACEPPGGRCGAIGRMTTTGAVTEFTSGITGTYMSGIALGREGDLWFTEESETTRSTKIGRITPAGAVTEFSAGITLESFTGQITLGPDGNLWFTEPRGGRIGRITPSGVVTEFSRGITPRSVPEGIAAGADGNLWFTEFFGNRVARITPSGVVTEFSKGIPAGSEPYSIAAGPGGDLWFTERSGHIGVIEPG